MRVGRFRIKRLDINLGLPRIVRNERKPSTVRRDRGNWVGALIGAAAAALRYERPTISADGPFSYPLQRTTTFTLPIERTSGILTSRRLRCCFSRLITSHQSRGRPLRPGNPETFACSICVSTRAFERIRRVLRKPNSLKFLVFNAEHWCESHPLRHSKSLKLDRLFDSIS